MTNSISSSIPTDAIVPTSVPHVYATERALSLAEHFFSCPAAAKLLDSERFIKPILIDFNNSLSAQMIAKFDDDDHIIGAKILIPEESLKTTQALDSLAFEIFNAQRTGPISVRQEARLGNMGMDAFARQTEELEYRNNHEYFELIMQCIIEWMLFPRHNFMENLEVHLFVQERGCHTDYYRQTWIELFQKIYCEKHPDDSHSCETKTTDLCDIMRYLSMSIAEQIEFFEERTCKLFPQAHETVKNSPDIREIIQNKCPEALEKFSHRDEL